jgi:hypothetical protein
MTRVPRPAIEGYARVAPVAGGIRRLDHPRTVEL